MHPVMHFFVLIFMLSFLITGFEGLPPIPVMFTGSLQGRIDLQGNPCTHYRERVCSDELIICSCLVEEKKFLFELNASMSIL